MKAEDTSNYEHWYCAMCRAPRTARIKIIESIRRIETLANEAENLRIKHSCTSASFITEVNAGLKGMINRSDKYSIRIGVGLGFGVPLDGSVEDEFEDDSEDDTKGKIVNSREHVEDTGNSRSRVGDIEARQLDDDVVEPRKRRRTAAELVDKKKRK